MTSKPLSVETRRFIGRYIRSIEQLEILCLLAGDRDRFWSEAEVFKCIQSSRASVSASLRYFAGEGILISDPNSNYRFAPATAELARTAEDLAGTFRERRVTVIEAIYKVPGDSIRQFANAFRFRRDKA